MSDIHKCVITLNPNAYKMMASPFVITIPAGTQCIESFTINPDGSETVNETYIAGIGIVDGELPKK
jgi:hypothetical protein